MPSAQARVVVGIDGSPGGEKALRWPADEASLRYADLDVVSCWSAPPAITPAPSRLASELAKAKRP